MDELEDLTGPLKCSVCHRDLLGVAAIVGQPKEMLEQDDVAPWEGRDDVTVYQGSEIPFILLDPKCLHEMLDEVLRQELNAVLMVSIGKIDEIRAGLQM